ncbi:MAG: crossover junction endodeoxyribonuclease RuvC [Patescibacteria group bacterium]|nr:crossover junction endodeoxyribonuclease RuvC [Patescibacteria group bacterium]
MLVLGVDPGFGRTGLGVVRIEGSKMIHVWHSCIETDVHEDFACRLQAIRSVLDQVVKEYQPEVAVVEKLFFQTNVSTAINVGMARGVVLLVLADANLPVVELTPNEVKQSVAGYGSADKKQMQAMVTRLLNLKSVPKPDDAADALAIAMAGGQVFLTQKRLASNR